jgi:hypothetical protein
VASKRGFGNATPSVSFGARAAMFAPSIGPAFCREQSVGPEGDPGLTIATVTAASASADTWVATWVTPSGSVNGRLFSQLRFLSGTDPITDANFAATGGGCTTWEVGTEDQIWSADLKDAGSANTFLIGLTASPPVTGVTQFGVLYKNPYTLVGTVATASATL